MVKYILCCYLSFSIGEIAICKANTPISSCQNLNDTTKYKEVYKNTLKEMDPSLTGKTTHGNTYNLFAIKRGKQWTYLILDSTGYYSVKQDSKKSGMVENTKSHTEMLCMLYQAKLLKKIPKSKVVSDLTFSCYYKFKVSARKTYNSYNKMQRQAKFFEKNIHGGSKGINNILKRELK
jgi:hypothetical protein